MIFVHPDGRMLYHVIYRPHRCVLRAFNGGIATGYVHRLQIIGRFITKENAFQQLGYGKRRESSRKVSTLHKMLIVAVKHKIHRNQEMNRHVGNRSVDTMHPCNEYKTTSPGVHPQYDIIDELLCSSLMSITKINELWSCLATGYLSRFGLTLRQSL